MSNHPTTWWCQNSLMMLKQWATDCSHTCRPPNMSRIRRTRDCRHQLVRNPRQARDHHAQGHPAGPPHPRRTRLGSLEHINHPVFLNTTLLPPCIVVTICNHPSASQPPTTLLPASLGLPCIVATILKNVSVDERACFGVSNMVLDYPKYGPYGHGTCMGNA